MSNDSNKTVIVVGAGASHEFGLPVGTQLQDQISRITRFDFQGGGMNPSCRGVNFSNLLVNAVGLSEFTYADEQRIKLKSSRIADGVQYAASIDNFLHANQSDLELVAIGKLAISVSILLAEKNSTLYYQDTSIGFIGNRAGRNDIAPYHTWIGILTKYLASGRDFNKFCKAISSITFVCFNYDRCIQRFIFGVAELVFPTESFNNEQLSAALNIIHPYGSLGDLCPGDGANGTFGKLESQSLLLSAASNIKTFTEGMESNVISKIGTAFEEASSAYFLGYGFINVNDEFLFKSGPFELDSVIGTTFGISDERSQAIGQRLKRSCMMKRTPYDGWQEKAGAPRLYPDGCKDLLHRFSHEIEKIGKTI